MVFYKLGLTLYTYLQDFMDFFVFLFKTSLLFQKFTQFKLVKNISYSFKYN